MAASLSLDTTSCLQSVFGVVPDADDEGKQRRADEAGFLGDRRILFAGGVRSESSESSGILRPGIMWFMYETMISLTNTNKWTWDFRAI